MDLLGVIGRIPEVYNALVSLLGPNPRHHHSKISSRYPGGKGEWLPHQDGYSWRCADGNKGGHMLSIAFALNDTDEGNGCLCLVPKSSRYETAPENGEFVKTHDSIYIAEDKLRSNLQQMHSEGLVDA
jgi:ectoine hydroxylase-related dioxygenase (phytanoyl-CoA dioxygenase family)